MKTSSLPLKLAKFFLILFCFVVFQCICEGIARSHVEAPDGIPFNFHIYGVASWVLFTIYWILGLCVSWWASTKDW